MVPVYACAGGEPLTILQQHQAHKIATYRAPLTAVVLWGVLVQTNIWLPRCFLSLNLDMLSEIVSASVVGPMKNLNHSDLMTGNLAIAAPVGMLSLFVCASSYADTIFSLLTRDTAGQLQCIPMTCDSCPEASADTHSCARCLGCSQKNELGDGKLCVRPSHAASELQAVSRLLPQDACPCWTVTERFDLQGLRPDGHSKGQAAACSAHRTCDISSCHVLL